MDTLRVSAAFIISDSHVLITQRSDRLHEGKWEFPGGKVEDGESGEDAVIREIGEELNLNIKVERLAATIRGNFDKRDMEIRLYQCSLAGGNLELKEHMAARWVLKEELKSYDLLVPDRLLLDIVLSEGA